MAPLLSILYMLDKCACLFVVLIFLINLSKTLTGMPSECQTVWIPVRPHMSGLIWVQTVNKDNKSVTIAGKELIINPNFERVTEI